MKVTGRTHNDKFQLSVWDNGRGFPTDFDPNDLDTLGFRLIKALINTDVDGELEIMQTNQTIVKVIVEI